MSMFSFPKDMNMNETMKSMNPMIDWAKATDMSVSPLMVYPLGAAAAATAVGFGIAGQMTGMMMGMMQGAMQNQGALFGKHPDLSWIVPTMAEDLAPEDDEAETPAPVKTKSAEVVELKPAARVEAKPEAVKAAAAKAKAKPAAKKAVAKKPAAVKADPVKPAEAPVNEAQVAVVEKLRSDAKIAAGVASEPVAAKVAEPKVVEPPAAKTLEPEDFRRPAEIEKPETPDDLKLISGVGPKLEQVLNGLGVWTYAQIAAWQPEEVAWVDDYLQFKGRIDRDDWIAQAGALAKGGATAG